MKKKVFSLMMMLLLAFVGVARADELTVNDGTTTNGYVPVYGFYADAYLKCEFVQPAADLAAMNGATINGMTFYASQSSVSWGSANFQVFLTEVGSTSISAFNGPGTVVYEGALSISGGQMAVTFTTPYHYNGGNLLVGFYLTQTGSYVTSSWYGVNATGASVQGYSYSSLSDISATQRNFLPKTTFTYTAGGGGGMEEQLHVKYVNAEGEEVIDDLNLGTRPAGCWMEPFQFTMYSEGPTYTVNILDFTPSDGMFEVNGVELPMQVTSSEEVEMGISTTATAPEGLIERQFVAITEGNRAAHIWPIVVEMYEPAIPDVVELAYDFGTIAPGFSYEGDPADITPTTLHNDYTLPFPEIEEGEDAVYKFTVEEDVIISAHVNEDADNGKVALYTEDFYGEGGPMATNNYTGLSISGGGGSAGAPFVAQIGEGTTTSTYFPFHTLWNYSLSENLFLATELAEAGVTTAPMTSLSWYVASTTCTTPQNGISIWMANVSDEALTTTSHLTAGMNLVYTGDAVLPVAGQWNEFVFNEGNFAWDGHSNILIVCQRLNGDWQGSVSWQTHNPGFVGMAYDYDDYEVYNCQTQTYSMYTSATNRANIIFKGGGRSEQPEVAEENLYSAGPVIENLPLTPGTYYLVASAKLSDDLTGGGAGMGNDDGNRDLDHYTVYINIDEMPCPAIDAEGFAFNPQPADDEDEVEPASVTLRWMVPEYATGWRLVFGSTYYPDPNHPQTIVYPEDGSFTTQMANSYTVRNLWNNTNYFWHVEFNNDGCPDGVSSPTWGFTTHLNIPTNLTAVDYTVFDDETIVLNWNAVVDRTYRFYNVYRDGVCIGNTQVNNISNTTYTDGPLDYNMDGYVYYVTAVYDEGESAPSDPITVKVSGYGDVNGHVYEQDGTTGIAGATVTMVGLDEFNVSHTYNFTTNAQGYYSGQVCAGHAYDGQAAKDGYQTAYEPVQGEPINVDHDQTTSPIDYIMDENFDPVCGVIAEYYPDSLDPESPYVKVYWGCGLPGSEIIEDFETGDFSMFDWQLDNNYPWSITTTNPYEGTYCMKSGGAGVANVVSNMSVTVEIPNDGIMSFFAKISCENSWDYGYFYIDNVQKGSFTGAGNWIEKTYDITAGEHTFKWSYTKDSSVNSNDDCFYVDYITFYKQPEPPIPGMTYDFEDGTMQGWTSVDADGDGYGWYMGSEIMTGQTGNNGSNDFVLSQSYYMGAVLYPDNYLVSPQVQLGGVVRFYACAQDASYAAEHFGLAVSTTNTNPSSFTMVQEWTMTAKGGDINGKPVKGSRSGRAQGNWYEYTVDLSSFSGMGYVAIRHFNCSDMFYLNVDDITIGEPGAKMANNDRSLHHYRVYRTNCYNDGPYTPENTVLLASVWVPDTVYIDVEWADLDPGVYKWGVGSVYEGNRGEEETRATLTYDFDDSSLQGWTTIDANNDGYNWVLGSQIGGVYLVSGASLAGSGHNSSADMMCSGSYSNVTGAITPDNYLVSPQIQLGGSISFWACAQDGTYPSEHFAVAVSTTGNTSASSFTNVQEWTMSAKSGDSGVMSLGRDGSNRAQGNWYQYTVDLSAYSGMGYVAIRHFNCNDQFILNVDDITIEEGAGGVGPTPGPGSNALQLERESEIVWSNCLDKDMYLNGVTVNVLLNSADSPEGTTVDFTNLNEYEQQNFGGYNLTLDESGFYAFESFRRGEYAIKVELDGYETINDTVSIWSDTDLRYVMTEILYGVGNVYVSRTGWAMWDGTYDPNNGGNGGGGNYPTSFSEDFEGGFANWTLIDADGDGLNWYHSSQSQTYACYDYTGWGHNETDGFAVSSSYTDCTYDSFDPNNFLITNQKYSITASSVLNFWADYGNDSYPDHFGVAVATVDNPTANDFTMVWEGSAKNGNAGKSQIRHNDNRYFNWRSHSVDLSAYAGQDVYIAFRHFNSYDQYEIYIDDVELTAGAKSDERHFEYYKVMCTSIDGVPIYNHNTVWPFCQLSTNEPYNAPLVEGETYLCKVAVMYSTGMSEWSEPVAWVYEPCDHWGPVDEVTATTLTQGNHIEWVFEHGYNPYDPGTGGGGQGGTASTFTTGFEGGLPEGWTVIDGNNDGYTWCATSAIPTTWTYYASLTLDWYHSGSDAMCSGSYINGVGAITPDEYLVSPQVTLVNGSQLSFWVAACDASYPADHFGVFVSDNGTSNWTSVQEWTLTAKKSGVAGGRASRDGEGLRLGTWYNYTVDLSAYAGQKYIAFRHFNCNDQYIMCLDDVELTAGSKGYNAMNSGMIGDVYAFNITDIANFDERVYFLYKLVNDNRFNVIQGEAAGMFIISANNANLDLEEAVNEFVYNNNIEFGQMDKVQAANTANAYKAALPAGFTNSLMMDMYIQSRENNLCELGAPFCTDEGMYEFPAGVNAGSGEAGPDYDCLYTTPNPAWYYMKISDPGDMDIYMYSTPSVDIDFCCWGPFDDPFSPCPYGLTEDKVVSCSYSAQPTEHCMIPATAQTGEYYILVITNYSNQPCNINFSKIAGSGTTDCTIVVPTVDLIGFLITQDGEYLAFVGPDVREYTDLNEFGDHEYCVRPIYPGEMILPDHNYGWSMGCPVCASPNGQITCEPGAPIHAEELHATDQVKIWWGEEPVPPMEDWIYYDNGVYSDAIGTGGSTVYWAAMFPANSIAAYAGTNLTKVAMYEDPELNMQTITTYVYLGGSNAPGTLVSTQTFNPTGSEGFHEVALNTPVGIDGTQNLWIVFSEYGTYPATGCVSTGDPNGRWISIDGVEWEDVASYGLDYTWMIRGFVTNMAKGGMVENIALAPITPAPVETSNMTLGRSGRVDSTPADLSFMNRSEIVTYNVYRSDDNVDYALVGTVPAVEGQTYYEYIDTPAAAGTYYYQVKAEYGNGCESEGAPAFDNPDQDFVTAEVTGLGENDGNVALYPNPTSGNVTIEAAGMSRITVVSVLGQVVFDTELNANNYTLNMAQFNAGMYMVRVYSENGVTVKRVTVMK